MTEQNQDQGKTENGQLESSASRDASCGLDVLIAERVMGWTPVLHYGERGTGFWAPSGCESDGPWLTADDIPHYSTDIAAAWLVVDQMHADGWWQDIEAITDGYIVTVQRFDPDDLGASEVRADTAPLAICRAALAAVEAEP